MIVLLDESMPRRFGRLLVGHEARTVQQMGWASVGNGDLLRRAAEAGFRALITVDRNLEFQQDVARAGLGLIVIIARSNSIADVGPSAPGVLDALSTLRPGQVVRVTSPTTRKRRDRSAEST